MQAASKPRARLSKAQVLIIFQARASVLTATNVASDYGVSDKAVRDIWTGRTWSRETWHLDTSRPLQLKVPGRPKGCLDKKPRKKRVNLRGELSAPTQVPLITQVPDRYRDDAFEPDALQVLLDNHPILTDPASYFGDHVASHQFRSAWLTSSTLLASVDEQLHKWDEFWRGSTSADPFCYDWRPQK
jgi:hypothetical protein